MKNFKELADSPKVQNVEFVGGGIAVVTLNRGFGNPKTGELGQPSSYHNANQTFHAYCFDAAKSFVEGAEASTYANSPGGRACRVAEGTSWACNPHSEAYWSA